MFSKFLWVASFLLFGFFFFPEIQSSQKLLAKRSPQVMPVTSHDSVGFRCQLVRAVTTTKHELELLHSFRVVCGLNELGHACSQYLRVCFASGSLGLETRRALCPLLWSRLKTTKVCFSRCGVSMEAGPSPSRPSSEPQCLDCNELPKYLFQEFGL